MLAVFAVAYPVTAALLETGVDRWLRQRPERAAMRSGLLSRSRDLHALVTLLIAAMLVAVCAQVRAHEVALALGGPFADLVGRLRLDRYRVTVLMFLQVTVLLAHLAGRRRDEHPSPMWLAAACSWAALGAGAFDVVLAWLCAQAWLARLTGAARAPKRGLSVRGATWVAWSCSGLVVLSVAAWLAHATRSRDLDSIRVQSLSLATADLQSSLVLLVLAVMARWTLLLTHRRTLTWCSENARACAAWTGCGAALDLHLLAPMGYGLLPATATDSMRGPIAVLALAALLWSAANAWVSRPVQAVAWTGPHLAVTFMLMAVGGPRGAAAALSCGLALAVLRQAAVFRGRWLHTAAALCAGGVAPSLIAVSLWTARRLAGHAGPVPAAWAAVAWIAACCIAAGMWLFRAPAGDGAPAMNQLPGWIAIAAIVLAGVLCGHVVLSWLATGFADAMSAPFSFET